MPGYYISTLSAERLRQVYDLAPPRTRQYLEAEIKHLLTQIGPADTVLELGCGYGRVLARLAEKTATVVGIDTSLSSLRYGRRFLQTSPDCGLVCADAGHLPFRDRSFDCVICIQNGISAFKIDPRDLIRESLRITKVGGKAIFSSYSEKFWPERLHWFELQSKAGLVGPIDYGKTGNGVIVCTDGFTARTFSPDEFRALASEFDAQVTIEEIDESSLFCALTKR
jgi:ubiquinone/menaquinone biosynthesis C-methylase UbiE